MKRTIVMLSAVVSFSFTAFAQSKPEPPKRTVMLPSDSAKQDENLPKIDLPEFQITGKETPELIESAKPGIDEERVYDLSAQLLTVGERESAKVSLGDFSKAQSGFAQKVKGFSGKVTVGYGSYVTPMFDGWVGTSSGNADVLLRVGYKSSDGRFANQDYRNGSAGLSGGLYLPDDAGIFSKGRLRGNFGFDGESYKLYGSLRPTRSRSLNRFNGDLSLNMSYAEGGFLNSAVHINNASLVDSVRSGENYAGIELAGGKTIDMTQLKAEMSLWRNFYASPSVKHDPYFTHVGVSAQCRIGEDVDIMGGATMFLVRGSEGESKGTIQPKLGVAWYVRQGFTLFARYEPFVQRTTLSSLAETNPYIVNDARIQNTEYFNNVSLGTELEISRAVKVKASINYKRAWNHPIFVDISNAHVWSVAYFGTTRIMSFESELSADITTDDHLGATFAVRNNQNFDTNNELPYFPQVVLGALYQHRFPFKLSLMSNLKYIDRQYADIANTRSLSSFLLWDARAVYEIIQRLSVGLAVENILDQQQHWWENYVGQPRRAMLSVGFTW